jgi:hypothetical protein
MRVWVTLNCMAELDTLPRRTCLEGRLPLFLGGGDPPRRKDADWGGWRVAIENNKKRGHGKKVCSAVLPFYLLSARQQPCASVPQ